MPQLYHNAVVTNAGLALLDKAQVGEASIRFTRMATGDGVYTDDEKVPSALQKLVRLKSEKNSYPLSSVHAVPDGGVEITALIANQDPITGEALVSEGYSIREIGLFAKEKDGDSSTEVLYGITVAKNADGDYMPPYDGGVPVEIVQEYHAAISNSENVSIHLTGTGAPMLAEDAEKRFQEIYEAIPPVDSELNSDSENPVQNKVVAGRIAELVLQISTAWDAQKLYIDTKIGQLINGAPETLDTLKEVADAIQENETVIEALDAAIGNKVDKVAGKGLSTNDFTTEEKNKLAGMPTVNNAKLTIQRNGTQIQTFTANQGTDATVNIVVPTKTSELEDDAGFGSSSITVDTEMSETSTNPVQNKVITAYINKLHGSTLHGFEINQAEPDPDSVITYIGDSATRSPVYMDYANDKFNYGGWDKEWFIEKLKPCMLSYGGSVAYELEKYNYAKNKDGTSSSISSASFDGNAMIGLPKVYWKVLRRSDDAARIYFCDENMDGTFNCWSHINSAGQEIDYCYLSIYEAALINSKLRSLSGLSPATELTAQQERNYARANYPSADIWNTGVLADRMLVNLLLLLIGKSTDTQTTFGDGNSDSYGGNMDSSGVLKTGTMNDKGIFWGAETGKEGVKVFGIEHWWGNLNKRIAGSINNKGVLKLKMTHGMQDGTQVSGYNDDGTGYIEIPNSTPVGNNGDYIKRMLFSQYGLLPIGAGDGASATTYYCDGFWNGNNEGVGYHTVSGNTSTKKWAGALMANLVQLASRVTWDCCSFLSCKPLV